ncbi:transcriptional regulator [Pseudooceanicola sp. CBS1P-1]|uniref:GbsR/MarR family transcriptional regulator n=1 Tax=Pseudooceanicola TaxID=1679449 RepID=UPI0019256302|nr:MULTISPECIES: MarR family transcriptional regulator [Pseudooceanicola]MBT9384967.1 transcriptional regulator [Pseudooceanicola endophyticus]
MTTDAATDFIELMGLVMQEQGKPRIAGQVFGYLLLEGAPRTLGQISGALGVSKGSVSTNTRLLAAQGMLERVSPVGGRHDLYELAAHPNAPVLRTLAGRFRRNAARIEALSARFAPGQGAARGRVLELAAFYRSSAHYIDNARAVPGREDGLPAAPDPDHP